MLLVYGCEADSALGVAEEVGGVGDSKSAAGCLLSDWCYATRLSH